MDAESLDDAAFLDTGGAIAKGKPSRLISSPRAGTEAVECLCLASMPLELDQYLTTDACGMLGTIHIF
jgi:hypothetical protein